MSSPDLHPLTTVEKTITGHQPTGPPMQPPAWKIILISTDNGTVKRKKTRVADLHKKKRYKSQ